jgi:hypothetical protein
LIEGHICVVCTDDPIAVGPDGARGIVRIASGVSIASEVEPAASPVFAIGGGSKETIDGALEGFWGWVLKILIEEFLGGGQARDIEANATQEHTRGGCGGGHPAFFLKFTSEELIDGMLIPTWKWVGSG